MKTEITLTQYQKANRQMRLKDSKKGFKANLAAYTIVNSALITVNLLLVPVFPWAIFPLLGWGFGVLMHYNFGVRCADEILKAEEEKIEQLAAKAD
jgi:uncharacterized membrane protein YdbT with pleckstrin-like domain